MYKYVFTEADTKDGKVKILTPNCKDFSNVKIDKYISADCVRLHEEFPDGLILDIVQYNDKFEITSNKELAKNEDGNLTFV